MSEISKLPNVIQDCVTHEKFEWICFPSLDIEDYHADKNTISRSALMDFDESAYNYWAKHVNPLRPRKEPTNAMIMGSAFHCMILEPEMFNDRYAILPEPVLLKEVGKEQYELYKELVKQTECSGKTVLPYHMYVDLGKMLDVFQKNSIGAGLIKDARIENSFFWRDKHSGLILKCRPDALHSNIIVDLKTTSDASPRAFQNEMMKYGYHIQGAMIRDAVEIIDGNRIEKVIDVVIETKYPYAMGIYIIDEFALDEGHKKYKQICLDLKNALEQQVWIDYGVQTISLPKWAI